MFPRRRKTKNKKQKTKNKKQKTKTKNKRRIRIIRGGIEKSKEHLALLYPHDQLANLHNELERINNLLTSRCSNLRLLFALPSEIQSEITSYSRISNSSEHIIGEEYILCLMKNGNCISSLELKKNFNGNLSTDAATKKSEQSKNYSTLLSAVLILLSSKINVKNIKSISINPISLYKYSKNFNIIVKNINFSEPYDDRVRITDTISHLITIHSNTLHKTILFDPKKGPYTEELQKETPENIEFVEAHNKTLRTDEKELSGFLCKNKFIGKPITLESIQDFMKNGSIVDFSVPIDSSNIAKAEAILQSGKLVC
jgi:hypothetical protein